MDIVFGVIYLASDGTSLTKNSPYFSSLDECDWQQERSVSGILILPSILRDMQQSIVKI